MAIKDDFLSVRHDQRNQEGNSKSQVAALQISPIPQVPDRDTRSTEGSTSRGHKNARKRNTLVSAKRSAGPGFGFDIEIDDDELSRTPQTSITEVDDEVVIRPSQDAENSKVRRLAGVFMESGKALNVRYNVVDALDNKKETGPGAPNKKQLQISRTTKNRKETVMAVISLKYHWLAKCQEVYSSDAIKYPGVEGVYNPLQIIRNRAIRAKHHEPVPPLRYANLPLACNVFSSHKQANGKPWKMLWGIELNELINDEAWRAQHWNELRDPNGNLWFPDSRPPAHSVISFDTPSKPHKNRLHDKLWGDVDSEDRTSSRSKSPASKNIRNNIKQKAKRLYGSVSSNGNSASDVELSSNDVGKSHESLSRQKQSSKSDSDSNGGQIFQFPRNFGSSGSSEGQNAQYELPKIKIDTNAVSNEALEGKTESQHIEEYSANRTRSNLDDVQINPLHSNTHSSISQALVEPPKSPDIDSKELKLLDAFAHGQSMESQLTLNEGFLSTVFPHLVESTSTRLENILNNNINVILHNIVSVNDNQLPAHESFYTGFLSECKSLMNVINDEYAVKIGHLLSATDRSMGEINTSLSLDMKKVNENLDRVNQSLFGTIVASSVSDRNITLTDGGNYKILYFLLENTIVIVLRLTWLVANIFKFFLAILKIIWKLTSILFGI